MSRHVPMRWRALLSAALTLALTGPAYAQTEAPAVAPTLNPPQTTGRTETYRETRPVAPGVELSTVELHGPDGATGEPGWLQTYQMSVDLTSGVQIDRLFPGQIAATRPLLDMAREAGAVAAVNADYFDISGSGAPWGVSIQNGELLQSPLPNTKATLTDQTAVMFSEDQVGAIGEIVFEGSVALPGGRTVPLDALNKAELLDGQIGMFTPVWGTYCRCHPVKGVERTIEVVVRAGVVAEVAGVPRAGALPEDAFVLVGREAGAEALSSLRVGDPVSVDYDVRAPGDMKVKAAMSGRQLLVADGEPLELPAANNTPEPRTAVGFSADGTKMWLVAVDGRQPEFSRGLGLNELARMMVDLGAHSALNLDGGGSTTLVARDPGQEDADIVNRPSDAAGTRPVPTGLAMFLPEGSGRARGFWVRTATERDRFPGPDPAASWRTERVFPGLTRALSADAFDETYGPADLPGNGVPQWRVADNRIGRVERDGVFRALSPGVTTVTAKRGKVTGDIKLTVLGELARLETGSGRLNLLERGATGTFEVNGSDSAGYAAPIDPADVTLTYDDAALNVTPDDTGAFTVTARADDGEHVVTVSADGVTTELIVVIGTSQDVVDTFDDTSNWDFWSLRATGTVSSTPDGRDGNGLKLDYDFTRSTETRGVGIWPAANLLPVAGEPTAFKLWVKAEGHVHRTRLEVVDRNGTLHTIEPAFITEPGWQQVTYELPDTMAYPVSLRRIFFNELDPDAGYVGTLILDELTAVVAN
ncbi:phosphodiester glycosidase family protein [Nonomuraea sp. MG754425]|uniref:phosphodiester glycosidase family protein n=1 Tax=Nonomuraea sp. MG754425 TaxID=2570319 RepID=UPI001F34C748|nr:phosphodiester glycosidase family protein [Nonomuraea sp. MG754425]MCF6475557.1 phosphodiester glycosidase family protein [Nonomuraea sp. MG754425]